MGSLWLKYLAMVRLDVGMALLVIHLCDYLDFCFYFLKSQTLLVYRPNV